MQRTPASQENKNIFSHIQHVFGADNIFTGIVDDNDQYLVDVISADNCPEPGVISHSTIMTSDYPLMRNGEEYPVRLELLGAAHKRFRRKKGDFRYVLATASFFIMKNKWFCAPGMVFARMLDYYNLSRTLHHLLFVPPALWDNHFNTVLDLGSKRVTWLLAVPISDAEAQLVHEQQSSEQLEALLERYEVDIFDLNRRSVV